MSTHDDAYPVKWEQNVRTTAHGLEMLCPHCDGWHTVQELLAVGCPQTGWTPDVLEIHK